MGLINFHKQIMIFAFLIAVILVLPGISLADVPVVNIISVSRTVINDDPVDDPDGSGYSDIEWMAEWEEAGLTGTYEVITANGVTVTAQTNYNEGNIITTRILPEHLEEGSNTINIEVTVTNTSSTTGKESQNITLDTEEPLEPPSLNAEPGDEKVFLNWTPSTSDDTDGYFVYVAEVSVATNFEPGTTKPEDYDNYNDPIKVTGGDTSAATVTGLVNDTEYAFAISSYDEATNESGLFAGELGVGITAMPKNAVGLGGITDEEGGCFIATAAFGSYQSRYVKALREFRDKYLLTNEWGRKFVAWYYRFSPLLANYIAESETLKTLVRLLLIPLIGLSLFLINTTLLHKCFLLCLLLSSLIWLISRRRARKKVLALIPLFFLLMVISSSTLAADESSQNFSVELKGAPYKPQDIDPSYELIYGDGRGALFEIEWGWQIFHRMGILGLDAGVGYFQQTGQGVNPDPEVPDPADWEQSREEYVFRIIPTEVSAVYRLAYFKNQLLVPFAKAGIDYYGFWESRKDGEEDFYGGKWGYHYGGGVQFLLDYFDQKHSNKLDTDYGINNTYLIFEYRRASVDNFGEDEGFDFSNSTLLGGLMFEY